MYCCRLRGDVKLPECARGQEKYFMSARNARARYMWRGTGATDSSRHSGWQMGSGHEATSAQSQWCTESRKLSARTEERADSERAFKPASRRTEDVGRAPGKRSPLCGMRR